MNKFNHLKIPLEIITRATGNFYADNYIAEGGYGKVYRGEYFHSNGWTVGAVKLFKRSEEQADVSFWREIVLLSSYKHKNLISLLGFCDEREQRIIVYEYASNKSFDFHLSNPNLTWIQRLNICLGAARGLEYLHDPMGKQQRILHRDIKSGNILLDANWNAKIADFGLSKYGPANQEHTFLVSDAKGTLGYCDPVYLETGLLSKESDVYSFGVVLFEILCSRLCVVYNYTDERRSLPRLVKKCREEEKLDSIINVDLRKQIEYNCFYTFVSLAYQCLEREHTDRPTMSTVVRKLEIALEYQAGFKVEKAERRNIISGKQVAQEKGGKSHVLQKVAAYESNIQEASRRNGYFQYSEGHSGQEQEPDSSSDSSRELIENNLRFSLYPKCCPPGGSKSAILYTATTNWDPLVLKDCSRVRAVIESHKDLYQERDVSVHPVFKDELTEMLGEFEDLPMLFIRGRCIGGPDDILGLHRRGELRQLLLLAG